MPLKESPPGEVGADPQPEAGTTYQNTSNHDEAGTHQSSGLRGVFPTCTRCGARVQHHSVLVCFHCRSAT
jgi:hypothetical protein